MKKVLLSLLIFVSIVIIVFSFVLVSFTNSYEAADNIEKKIIEAGLVNNSKIDMGLNPFRKNI